MVGGRVVGFVGGGLELFGWDGGGLLFMDLGQGGDPGRGFVGAAFGGLVEAEGLERSGEGKEEECRGDEDAQIEMGVADVMQQVSLGGHLSFVQKISI